MNFLDKESILFGGICKLTRNPNLTFFWGGGGVKGGGRVSVHA